MTVRSKLWTARGWAALFTFGVYLGLAVIGWVIAWLSDSRPSLECSGGVLFGCPRDAVLISAMLVLPFAAIGVIVAVVLVGLAPRIEALRDRSAVAIGGWAAAMVWLVGALLLVGYVVIGLAE
jgi:hypothetical protein